MYVGTGDAAAKRFFKARGHPSEPASSPPAHATTVGSGGRTTRSGRAVATVNYREGHDVDTSDTEDDDDDDEIMPARRRRGGAAAAAGGRRGPVKREDDDDEEFSGGR